MSNDIVTGLRVATQEHLNPKEYSLNEATLASLGVNNNLAYTYPKGLRVYCIEERTYWEWREPDSPSENGLMVNNFTYPNGLIVNGIDYSNKEYNFFPASSLQDNFVRLLFVEENNLPPEYTVQDICDYILTLPAIDRTIAETDSKWNVVVGNTGDSTFVIESIYEIVNKGKGLLSAIVPSNLLLLFSRSGNPGLEDVINNDNSIDNFHAIIFNGTGGLVFGASVNNAGVIKIIGQDGGVSPSLQVGISDIDGNPKTSLDFYNNKTLFRDALNKGIEYSGDYEANFSARSLITKQHLDSLLPYKFYMAVIFQEGTDNPSLQVIYNNTGKTFTASRAGLGQYTITASSAMSLSPTKVVPTISPGFKDAVTGIQYNQDGLTFQINSVSVATGSETDGGMYNDILEIKIFN